jgi:hypothetical protein
VSDTQLCQWATDRNGTFLGERRGLRQAPRLLLPAQITVDTSPDGEFGGKRVQLVLSIDGCFFFAEFLSRKKLSRDLLRPLDCQLFRTVQTVNWQHHDPVLLAKRVIDEMSQRRPLRSPHSSIKTDRAEYD